MHEEWLYDRRRAVRMWREEGHAGAVAEALTEAEAGIEALVAAGVLDAVEARRWRGTVAAEDAPAPAGPGARAAVEALLAELLEAGEAGSERFQGALAAAVAAGAVDGDAWDARQRERLGWPSEEEELAEERGLNAGGTMVDLVAVLPGPPERRAGFRVIAVLRFADGIAFALDEEGRPFDDWPDWRLTDDAGTFYMPTGGEHFRTPPPAEATWVELALEGEPEATFRIAL